MVKIKTRRKMGWIALIFHWVMMLCTIGLWTPVYLAARRRRVTVTYVPDSYNGPIPPAH
jgi:cytochrome b561